MISCIKEAEHKTDVIDSTKGYLQHRQNNEFLQMQCARKVHVLPVLGHQ